MKITSTSFYNFLIASLCLDLSFLVITTAVTSLVKRCHCIDLQNICRASDYLLRTVLSLGYLVLFSASVCLVDARFVLRLAFEE